MRAPSARAKRPTHRAAKPHHASPLVAHVRATKRRGPQLGGTGASGYEAKLTPHPPTVPPAGGDVGQAPPPVVHSTAAGPPRSVREVVVLFACVHVGMGVAPTVLRSSGREAPGLD